MDIFSFDDFRKFIGAMIELNGHIKGYRRSLSRAAGFQPSYLSQVLHGNVLISSDNALGMSAFWEHSVDETECFFNLVNLSRAQSPLAKSYFTKKLEFLKTRHNNLSVRLKMEGASLEKEKQSLYYSTWYWSAIHIATSLKNVSTSADIANLLGIDPKLTLRTLNELEKIGLVEKRGNRWCISLNHLHLAKDSPFNIINLSNWRQKAITQIQHADKSAIHYSVLYGLSKEDNEYLRSLILNLIEKAKRIVEPSNEEKLTCFNCDFFSFEPSPRIN